MQNDESSKRIKKRALITSIAILLISAGLGYFTYWIFLKTGESNQPNDKTVIDYEIFPESDECNQLNNKLVLDYNEVIACYRTVEFDSNAAKKVIKSLREQMQLSSIVDFLKENPDPHFNKRINVDEDLKRIGYEVYPSDFDFHYTLSKYFKTLQEGYTEYLSIGYSTFQFELPVSLMAYHNEEEVLLKVWDYTPQQELDNEWSNRGLQVSKFIGDTVLEIEGLPAMQYIQNYADEFVGASRDPNFRVRSALAHTIEFKPQTKINVGLFTKMILPPNKPTIEINFKNNGRVQIPYLAPSQANLGSNKKFYDTYINPNRKKFIIFQDPIQIKKSNVKLNTIYSGKYINIYKVKDAAVINIPVFPIYSLLYSEWSDELKLAYTKLIKHGFNKFVFDVSNNPGGLIYAAYDLLKLFFPEARKNTFENYLTNRPPLKKLGEELMKFSGKMTSYYEKEKSFMESLADIIRKHSSSDTFRIPVRIDWPSERSLKNLIMDEPPIPLKSMALMSNGICASACTLFSNWIQENTEIPTYHVGNFLSQPATIGSCIGGSAFQGYVQNSDLARVNIVAAELPANIHFGFSLLGFYSTRKPQQALDFTWFPVKHTINVSEADYTDPIPMWSKIIDKL